jgi:hypothetical protein
MRHLRSISVWLMELFNPPRRSEMTLRQKIGRIALITTTLITLSILVALELDLVLYTVHAIANIPYLANALEILGASIVVNIGCVMVLLKIRRLDQQLMQPPPTMTDEKKT